MEHEPVIAPGRGRAPRPTPRPPLPWLLSQTWRDVAFLHWPVPVAALRAHVPASLTIDVHEGDAWIGVTAFLATGSRLRGIVPVAGARTFAQVRIATYVRIGDRPGVLPLGVYASSRLAVLGARALHRLPYRTATVRVTHERERHEREWIAYRSRRADGAELSVRVRPTGEAFSPEPGSLEHFLFERYALFSVTGGGRVLENDVTHAPWRLRPAEARVERITWGRALGLDLEGEPLAHLCDDQHVRIWPPRRATWRPLPSA